MTQETVSTQWLSEHLQSPDISVLDCSWHMPATKRIGYAEFLEARIPGAQFFDIDELSGNFIAMIVVFQSILAKVLRGRVHRARDHIPGGSPVAHVINGGERSRDVIWLAETGRNGRAEADFAGDARQAGEQRRGF